MENKLSKFLSGLKIGDEIVIRAKVVEQKSSEETYTTAFLSSKDQLLNEKLCEVISIKHTHN